MRFPTFITVAAIERNAHREGFDSPFHKVVFRLDSEGVPESRMTIWIHPRWPDEHLEKVARTFLRQRLLDMVDASGETFSEQDIEELWEEIRPRQ